MRNSRPPQLSQFLLVLLFGVFTFVPLIAFVIGVRGDAAENQAAAVRPSITAGMLFDTEKTASFDDYFSDALPFREDMVRADGRVDLALGDSPTSLVTVGRDGWLFFAESIEQPCLTRAQIDAFAATLERAERVVAATGRELVVVVGPDKASVHADQLSEQAPCVASNAQAIEGVLAPRHAMGWTELLAASKQSQTYFSTDTHWTPTGARTVAEVAMNAIADGAWQGQGRVDLGVAASCTTDLSRMIGDPAAENFDSFSLVAPGSSDGGCAELAAPATVVDPLGPSAHIAHDSFGNALVPFLKPYFSSLTTSPKTSLLGLDTPDALASSDVIIWQSVQRVVFERLATFDLASELVVGLRNELTLTPAAVTWDGTQAMVSIDDSTQEQYVLVSLAQGSTTAQVFVNGRQQLITETDPAVGFYATSPVATFRLNTGDVDVQITSVAADG